MATLGEREEQYLLRFEDPATAARVRAVLREEEGAQAGDAEMSLDWDGALREERERAGSGRRFPSRPLSASTSLSSFLSSRDARFAPAPSAHVD